MVKIRGVQSVLCCVLACTPFAMLLSPTAGAAPAVDPEHAVTAQRVPSSSMQADEADGATLVTWGSPSSRTLAHNSGCTSATCLRWCPTCTFSSSSSNVGHCRQRRTYLNCLRRASFTGSPFPPIDGVPPLPPPPPFPANPLTDAAFGADPDTEVRLSDAVYEFGSEYLDDDVP
eukprot:jgi/Ulvmu1/3576/UM168_0008.1